MMADFGFCFLSPPVEFLLTVSMFSILFLVLLLPADSRISALCEKSSSDSMPEACREKSFNYFSRDITYSDVFSHSSISAISFRKAR